jgi:hypothetical protein
VQQRNFWFYTLLMFGLFSCGDSGKKSEVSPSITLPSTTFFQFQAEVTGLEGTLVLSNNGKNDVTIKSNGLTTFPSTWIQQGSYEIKVMDEPCSQRCTVDKPYGQIGINGLLTLSVSCGPKTWDYPLAGSDHDSLPNTDAKTPKVVMNKYGDMILTWFQNDYFNLQLYKKQYQNRKWDNPSSITDHFSFAGSDVVDSFLALNDYNQASILWTQDLSGNKKVYVGDYDQEWDFPSNTSQDLNIEGQSAGSNRPVVRINELGEKIAAWTQIDSANIRRLYKAEFRNGSWTYPENLNDNINPDGTDVSSVDAAIDNLGNIIIAWRQSDGNYESIYKSEYRNGIWTHPLTISNDITMPGTHAYEPQVVMNDAGDAYISWHQQDNTSTSRYQISVAEYHNGEWDIPVSLTDNISPNGKHSKYSRLALNNVGQVEVVFAYLENDSDDDYQMAIQGKSPGENWSSPIILSTTYANESPSRASVGIDDQGNILVAWSLQNTGEVYKAEYRNGNWLLANLTAPVNFNPAMYDAPSVSVSNCRAALAWQQENDSGINQVYIAQYH